jgi:Amt family ammonium transporter
MKTVTSGRARLAGIIAGALLMLFAAPAIAQDGLDTGDTAWMLTATLLVLMMTIPGLALFYGGMVRKKHTLSMVMQSFAIACLATIVWMVAGYSLAFTDGGGANAVVGGLGNLFLWNLSADAMSGTIPETVFMTFQMTFAIITPALITGSLADRMKFSTLLVFVAVWIIVVYAPITHWVWGGGFLAEEGVLDFAGGTVVHINAGVSGLVAALIVGKRHGYGREYMAPHNLVYSIIGASLLWVGWFGFNAGSAVAADNAAGMAMAVTQISAAAAGLSWMILEWAVRGKPSVLGIVSGVVGGLVAITPAAGYVAPGGALVIGLVAGAVCFWGATWLKNKLGYDDSLDCFGVHGIGGIVGAVLTGVFAIEAIGGTAGALEGNAGQILIQIEGIVATIAWSAIATAVILLILKAVMGLRVDTEAEIEGLDLAIHGETVQ